VHHRPALIGGVRSDVDDSRFFLAAEGRTDARAELEATLRALHRPPGRSPDAHARCRYPARLHWLDQQLRFARDLRPMRCPALEAHVAAMTPDAVSLVYAANSLDSPVTAFGHTFLHFHRAGREDVVVEYTAKSDTKNPVLYVARGLSGMFRGRYYQHPAGPKRAWYLERGRDLWDYELALTPEERAQLARHLWELTGAPFDYYYMSENCSYGVLVLLEGAVHRLALTEQTRFVVPPVDTVKALFDREGRVRAIRYQAAHRTSGAPPAQKAPHLGHGSMRVVLGTGFASPHEDGFATLGYRMALHDLADPPVGQPALSQIQFLDARVRYEARRRRFTLNDVTFAELLALQPLALGFRPSWRARAYGQRLRDAGCRSDDCFAHGLNGSLGLTLATSDERLAAFVMADAYTVFSGQLDGIGGGPVRTGIGPYAGLRVHGPAELVGVLSGSWSYLPAQDVDRTYELRGALRGALARDVALGVEALLQPRAMEAQLVSYLYF
jgi:hypothetical protein